MLSAIFMLSDLRFEICMHKLLVRQSDKREKADVPSLCVYLLLNSHQVTRISGHFQLRTTIRAHEGTTLYLSIYDCTG